MRCLWLMRMYPIPLDAGDATYSFHLLSSVGSAGVRLTVLAMRRTGDRVRSPSDNEIEWVLIPNESDRNMAGRLAYSAASRMLRANIISHRPPRAPSADGTRLGCDRRRPSRNGLGLASGRGLSAQEAGWGTSEQGAGARENWNRNFVSQRRVGNCAPAWGAFGCLCGVLAQCGHTTPPGGAADAGAP
jgi:hypothetical protein